MDLNNSLLLIFLIAPSVINIPIEKYEHSFSFYVSLSLKVNRHIKNENKNSKNTMIKLQKSIEKRNALLQATLSLVNSGGIQSASMAKIAKIAGVSPATIYLYFENKQDLVNQLYLTVKSEFTQKAFEGFDENAPVKQSFKQIWFNMAHYKLNNTAQSSFLSQCDNSPIIDETTREEGLKHIQPLFDLMIRGQKEGVIKSISPYLFYAHTIYPISFLLNMQKRGLFQLSDNCLKDSCQSAWDSIKTETSNK